MKRWRLLGGARRLVPRLVRLALLGAVVLAFALVTLVRVSVARSERALMALGSHLSTMAEAGLGEGGRAVMINGQAIGFRVLTVDQPVGAVLDRYEAWCRGDAEALLEPDTLGELDATVSIPEPSWRDMTLRDDDGDRRGFVACLHRDRRARDEDLAAAVERFAASGDLGELGRFHYAYVERASASTRVILVYAAAGFRPLEVFPATGDAPGTDMPAVPRPPSGRRVLSAGEAGHDALLVAYHDVAQPVGELAAFYRAALGRNRFRILADNPGADGAHLLVVEHDALLMVVHLARGRDATSTVTLARAN